MLGFLDLDSELELLVDRWIDGMGVGKLHGWMDGVSVLGLMREGMLNAYEGYIWDSGSSNNDHGNGMGVGMERNGWVEFSMGKV